MGSRNAGEKSQTKSRATGDSVISMRSLRIEEGLSRQLVQLAGELSIRKGERVSVNALIREAVICAYGLVVPGNTPEWRERAELLQAASEGLARTSIVDSARGLGNDRGTGVTFDIRAANDGMRAPGRGADAEPIRKRLLLVMTAWRLFLNADPHNEYLSEGWLSELGVLPKRSSDDSIGMLFGEDFVRALILLLGHAIDPELEAEVGKVIHAYEELSARQVEVEELQNERELAEEELMQRIKQECVDYFYKARRAEVDLGAYRELVQQAKERGVARSAIESVELYLSRAYDQIYRRTKGALQSKYRARIWDPKHSHRADAGISPEDVEVAAGDAVAEFHRRARRTVALRLSLDNAVSSA